MCLLRLTKYLRCSPVLASTKTSRLPRLILPNVTIPSISETTAGLLGLRASNNSVTRGKPPVMSPVLPVTRGILTNICPNSILSPSLTMM